MTKRRKVVEVRDSIIGWSNLHSATLECGHVVTVQKRKGKNPKTSACHHCK